MNMLGSSGVDRPLCWRNILVLAGIHAAAFAGVPLYAAVHGVTWGAVAVGILLLAACGLSVTAGYHRLFAHGTYRAHPVVRAIFLFFGAGAVQNSALKWAADHRRHHAFTDRDEDPYSIAKGFWWAHMGWIFFRDPENPRGGNVRDLESDPLVRLQHRFYVTVATLAGAGVPLALGFLLGDPWGGLILGCFARLVFQIHATSCVNSVAHTIGRQPYSDRDSSRDSFVTALVSMGEGYHNFHHAFPYDYRNGVRAWHFDPSKWLIRALSLVRLARDLVRTPQETILKSRIHMDEKRAVARLPHAAELLRAGREKLEALLDRWAALRAQWAERRAIDRARLRAELREMRRRFREAYHQWLASLRRPELLATAP